MSVKNIEFKWVRGTYADSDYYLNDNSGSHVNPMNILFSLHNDTYKIN